MTGADERSRRPERIVVRAPNWLGDVVMSTPGLRALREATPDAQIVVIVPDALDALLEGNPDVDEVWTLGPRGLRTRRALAARIRSANFELAIVVPESISSAAMMRWARVPRVVGFARDAIRRALLHDVVPAPMAWGRRRLVSKERFVSTLMQAVGARPARHALRLFTTAEEAGRFEAVLVSCGLSSAELASDPPVVLAPGAAYGGAKCWPTRSYAALADALARRGERVVLVGVASERERAERIRRAMQTSPIDLTGRLDLGALKVLMAGARLLFANDSGVRHVAAAFRVPSVVFFGPTSIEKTNAHLESIEVLETEHGCRPCYRRECPIDHRCLTSIGVAEALAAGDRALRHDAPDSSRSAPRSAMRGHRG